LPDSRVEAGIIANVVQVCIFAGEAGVVEARVGGELQPRECLVCCGSARASAQAALYDDLAAE
jgi:hypothetical protein